MDRRYRINKRRKSLVSKFVVGLACNDENNFSEYDPGSSRRWCYDPKVNLATEDHPSSQVIINQMTMVRGEQEVQQNGAGRSTDN